MPLVYRPTHPGRTHRETAPLPKPPLRRPRLVRERAFDDQKSDAQRYPRYYQAAHPAYLALFHFYIVFLLTSYQYDHSRRRRKLAVTELSQ